MLKICLCAETFFFAVDEELAINALSCDFITSLCFREY